MGYLFLKTKDGSVGLYDDDVKDIYHSSLGAYKEALDKFVLPAQIERFKNGRCKVLDICYGIGYNTKALLKYSYEYNYNIQFKIDALEIQKDLIELSPFIKPAKFNNIDYEIDKFLLESYLKENKIDFDKINLIIKNNSSYLTKYKPDFNKIFKNYGCNYGVFTEICAFLHNIYYHNMATRLKKGQKCPNFIKNSIIWHTDDARSAVFRLQEKYDIIFLDAFTAAKQPILWTEQFIGRLVQMLNTETGIILSYSSSAPFRNALLKSGLEIGKFYTNNINTTLASYNKNLIKYKLDEFEKGLLNTKAGIVYEDYDLKGTCEEILNARQEKVNSSNLESTSSYYKRNNRRYGKY